MIAGIPGEMAASCVTSLRCRISVTDRLRSHHVIYDVTSLVGASDNPFDPDSVCRWFRRASMPAPGLYLRFLHEDDFSSSSLAVSVLSRGRVRIDRVLDW
jgi:hypothetical protein